MARRRPGSKDRVVGYIRVSTNEQHLGPEAQRRALVAWCTANDATLVAVHEDQGVSGGAALDRRPGLMAALAALPQNDAGVLLVAKRDRLARDVVLAAMIERLAERAGAQVTAADGAGNGAGPEAALMRGLIDLFAQYERALIRSRTKAAMSVMRARGQRVGSVAYGYCLAADKRYVEPETHEKRVIAMLQEWRTQGLSISAIVKRLDENSVPARGRRWHRTTVARILRRPHGNNAGTNEATIEGENAAQR
jgi:site-specific DNA recombinase